MKTLFLICRILFLLVAIAVFGLALGTMVGAVPFFGSIGGYIVLGWYRVFIPAVTAVFLAILILFFVKHKVLNLISAVFLVAAIVISCVCLSSVIMTFGEAGADVDVLKSYSAKTDECVKVDTHVYAAGADGDVTLDVYYTDGAADRPIIVYVHGGGWISGSKADHVYYSRIYAREGYVAVNVDYDLSTADRHLSATCEAQICQALAWLKTHAANYGGNPDKLYLTGDSAGGNLALDVAYKINDGVYATATDVTLPKIAAVAVTYPVADPAMFWANEDMVLGRYAKNMCESYTGTTPAEDMAAYDAITPGKYINAFTPPTMIIVGKADTMVQPEMSYALYDSLQAKGIDSRLVALPYLNHGFDGLDGSVGSQGVLSLTLQWFAQHQ